MGERKHIQLVGVIIIQPTWQEQDADPLSGTSVGSLGTPKHSACLASCDLPASRPHLLLPNLHPIDSNSWGVVSRPIACRSGVPAGWLQPSAHHLLQFPSVHRGGVTPTVLGRAQAELLEQ